ncbi:MAG TPA: hypothetical protein VGC79_27935, partial [Polyangiaceae bacterium]
AFFLAFFFAFFLAGAATAGAGAAFFALFFFFLAAIDPSSIFRLRNTCERNEEHFAIHVHAPSRSSLLISIDCLRDGTSITSDGASDGASDRASDGASDGEPRDARERGVACGAIAACLDPL